MRFAIAAVDRYLGVFEAFVHAGWQPLKLFTVPMIHESNSQHAVISYATQYKAEIQLSKITSRDMQALQEQGCEALIIASYDWKIGDWHPFLKYAVNFHASPLPEGRGPYPVPRAILDGWTYWGVTCHQITPQIDHGDILATETFSLHANECHESLDLKIQMAARRLATAVAHSFDDLWQKAKPQGSGSYWKRYHVKEHVIEFQQPIEHVMRHIRAFGNLGSLACISGTWISVKQAVGWTETHTHPPGYVAHVYNKSIVVAAADGYIGFLDFTLASPEVIAALKSSMDKKDTNH